MITEDYVSFEVAKLLKEKGFNKDAYTMSMYDENGEAKDVLLLKEGEEPVLRPTLQMVMKWLREVHNIDIDINVNVGILGVKVYIPMISTYRHREDSSDGFIQNRFGLHYKEDAALIPALRYFKTYEEAAEAAIKYCLENLISNDNI